MTNVSEATPSGVEVVIPLETYDLWLQLLAKARYRCGASHWQQSHRWDVETQLTVIENKMKLARVRSLRLAEDDESRGSDLYTEEQHEALMRKLGGQA